VRWISTTSFEENLWGAYGGGESTNGTERRVWQGGRREQVMEEGGCARQGRGARMGDAGHVRQGGGHEQVTGRGGGCAR
jgi:hypothetical protein